MNNGTGVKRLRSLAGLMKSYGLTKLVLEGVTLEMPSQAVKVQIIEEDAVAPGVREDQPSDADVLFHSSGPGDMPEVPAGLILGDDA